MLRGRLARLGQTIGMRHPIDPKIDWVFKALLGAEDNRGRLIHFLNAMLGAELPAPVTAVEILNPYNERECLTDKLSIVDVKARDDQGRFYQIEIQLRPHADLPARILYTWTDSGRVDKRSASTEPVGTAVGGCGAPADRAYLRLRAARLIHPKRTTPPMPTAIGCATSGAAACSTTAASPSSSWVNSPPRWSLAKSSAGSNSSRKGNAWTPTGYPPGCRPSK